MSHIMSLGASVKFGVNCGLLRGKFSSGQSKGVWTTKLAAKSGEYKGRGAPPAGRHTRKGTLARESEFVFISLIMPIFLV